MRIAMTGATGLIGSYAAKALAEDGHDVVALVRQASASAHIDKLLADKVAGTFADPQAQVKLCQGADCLVHSAADWQALLASDAENLRVNVMGTLSLLEAARQAGVKQFIFLSSISAYHEILLDRKLDENHPTWPNSQYGAYKAGVEPFLKAYHFQHGMNTVSLRPGAVYGIAPQLDRSLYYPLVRKVLDGQPIDTDHGGKVVSVQDVAEAVRRCVGSERVAGKFLVLVDCYVYDQEVAEMARETSGSASDIAERKGAGPRNHFDVSAARALGVPLNHGRGGIEEYVEDLIEAMK